MIINRNRPYPSLKRWREAFGLNQGQAAQQLGVSPSYYSRLENGEQHPHRTLAKAISDETGVPLETVLGV